MSVLMISILSYTVYGLFTGFSVAYINTFWHFLTWYGFGELTWNYLIVRYCCMPDAVWRSTSATVSFLTIKNEKCPAHLATYASR